MSIFSNIRKSRRQAKEHNAKLAEQKKKEEDKVPYRHVPTHAAADAIASAPPSWRESDRPRIMEQNRRRSAMAATGHHMNMPGPGLPRVGSSLSHVSYPSNNANPMVRLPRTYSYNGVSPYPDRSSREVIYSVPDVGYLQPISMKGKEIPRGPGFEPLRISPSSSRGEPSPAESSTGSSSSQDDLEMRPVRPSIRAVGTGETAVATSTPTSSAHRLHPSHSRRPSAESSNDKGLTASSTKVSATTSASRDSRPPPSMRGFSSISAMSAAPLPAASHTNQSSIPAAVPAGYVSHQSNATNQPSSLASSRQNSAYSLPGLVPTAARGPTSAPTTPAAVPRSQPEYPLNWLNLPGPEINLASANDGVAVPTNKVDRPKDRRAPKTARFTEASGMETHTEPPYAELPRVDQSRAPRPLAHDDIVNVFPEQAPLPEYESSKSSKGKRLSKGGGGKLLKKSRWSSSKSPAVVV